MKRSRFMVIAAVVLTAVASPGAPTVVVHADGPAVNGGGSSFAKLEIDQWRAEVARQPFGLTLNYLAQGSSFGRQGYIDGSLEFAASDIPFQDEEMAALNATGRKDFAYVPVSAGGLGIMYNLQDQTGQQVRQLNLTRRVVCRIFTEPNMRWDDPEIASVNPAVRLPAQPVRPIVRADGSGTSYVLSEFCLTVAPDVWGAFIAAQGPDANSTKPFRDGLPTSNWPQNWAGVSSSVAADGVAAAVADPSGLYGVTYNEAGYAKIRNFPNASVQNAAGAFTQPTEEAVSIALGYAVGDADAKGTFKLNYTGPDPKAYFPSTYSYVIAQTTGFSADKGKVLARFLCYAVTKGQRVELTAKLGYARLSAPLVDIARTSIARIPGAPPWDQCKVDAAAPPPAATTIPPTTVPAGSGSGSGTGAGSGAGTGTGGVTSSTTASAAPGTGASNGSSAAPGAKPPQTSIVISATGETVVVTIPDDSSTAACVDPLTQLPADPATCAAAVAVADPGSSGDGTGQTAGAAPVAAAIPNPPIDTSSNGPDSTRIVWWLLQGAGICALGGALAGVRSRGA